MSSLSQKICRLDPTLAGDVLEGIPALFPKGAQTGGVGSGIRTQWVVNNDLSHCTLEMGPGGRGSHIPGFGFEDSPGPHTGLGRGEGLHWLLC